MDNPKADKNRAKEQRATAIDIGAHTVKLATVSMDAQGRFTLEQWTRVGVEGDIGDAAATTDALKTALARHGAPEGVVSVSLPRQRAVVRYVTLPSVVPDEIAEIMDLEVERHAPIPADEMEMGYEVVAERGGTESDILMVAAARSDLLRQLDLLRGAELEPDVITVAGMNIGRPFHEEERAGETIAVVDCGRTQTTVSVWRQGYTRFSRSLAVGTERLREALAETDPPVLLDDDTLDEETLARHPGWQKWFERLSVKLRRSFTAYEHDKGGTPVRKVRLTGGLAESPAIVSLLQQQLPYDVDASPPLGGGIRLKDDLAEPPPAMADCIGMAIHIAQHGRGGVNLLPSEVLATRRKARQRVFLRNCGFLAATLVVLLAGSLYLQWWQRYLTRSHLESQLAELTPRVREVRTKSDKMKKLMENIDADHSCFRIFYDIVEAMPDKTNISNFDFSKQDVVELQGDVETDNAATQWAQILRDDLSHHFKEVTPPTIKRKPISGTGVIAREYSVECTLVSKDTKPRLRR